MANELPPGFALAPTQFLESDDPDLVEEMIARLEEDPNFAVAVEREKVEG